MTREEAIKVLRKSIDNSVEMTIREWEEFDKQVSKAIDMAIEALKAEQIGEWVRKVKEINDCDGHRAYYWYECSVCGASPPKDTWKNEWHSNYCPSCGVRMKGGTDD